jgi:hypothetical protein
LFFFYLINVFHVFCIICELAIWQLLKSYISYPWSKFRNDSRPDLMQFIYNTFLLNSFHVIVLVCLNKKILRHFRCVRLTRRHPKRRARSSTTCTRDQIRRSWWTSWSRKSHLIVTSLERVFILSNLIWSFIEVIFSFISKICFRRLLPINTLNKQKKTFSLIVRNKLDGKICRKLFVL